MRGEGEPCKNGIDEGKVLGIVGTFQHEREITVYAGNHGRRAVGASLYRSDFGAHRPLTA